MAKFRWIVTLEQTDYWPDDLQFRDNNGLHSSPMDMRYTTAIELYFTNSKEAFRLIDYYERKAKDLGKDLKPAKIRDVEIGDSGKVVRQIRAYLLLGATFAGRSVGGSNNIRQFAIRFDQIRSTA